MKNYRFITPSTHGILDYLVDLALILIPLLFDFGSVSSLALYIPLAIGGSNLVYSLLTSYSRSVVKLIPMQFHLILDYLAGIILIIAALSLPLAAYPKLFFLVMGFGIVLATFFTKKN